MNEPETSSEQERYGRNIRILTGIMLLSLSLLIYLIGIYLSRTGYPNYIAEYPNTNFSTIIHPGVIAASLTAGLSLYIFIRAKSEMLVLAALVLIGIYLWNTNSLIVANARVYDSYWHYSISQLILDEHQFSFQDITSKTFYLNYPFTGIFGAEMSLVMDMQKENVVYYFPVVFSVILIAFIFATTRLFFKSSYGARAFAVMVFIVGNASLQTHFAPQTVGLISFAFLFYLMFKYSQRPELSVKIMMILVLFLTIVIHPLTSFNFGLILIAYVFTFVAFKQKSISSSMILLFFIFFFAWQTYWALTTSTLFFKQLSQTATLIFTLGPFATGGTEYFVQPQYFDPMFYRFRFAVHGIFIIISLLGWLILLHKDRQKWLEISCFIAGPVLYFIFTYFSYNSYLYERTIMLIYLPLSIPAGYLIFKSDVLRVSSPINDRMKFVDKLRLSRLEGLIDKQRRSAAAILTVAVIVLAAASISAFGLQEQPAVVPTQDIRGSRFVSEFGNGSVLCFQSNAVIYFYNISADIYDNPRHGWSYWREAHLPADDREVFYKPTIGNIMLSVKYRDISDDYFIIKNNLEDDTTENRVYDNGFIQVYT